MPTLHETAVVVGAVVMVHGGRGMGTQRFALALRALRAVHCMDAGQVREGGL
jgi:hypothetical protein